MFEEAKEKFQTFFDDQQRERLLRCLEIEKRVKKCEKKRSNLLRKQKLQQKHLQEARREKRPILASFWKNTDKTSTDLPEKIIEDSSIPNCSEEVHSLWQCRAVATGCGHEASKVMYCFREKEQTLNQSKMNSNINNAKVYSDSCAEEQKEMGRCVIKNMSSLDARIKERASKKEN